MAPDPATVVYAWSRYRRLMWWLMAVTVALMAVALRLALHHGGTASIRRYVLCALCLGLAMLLSSTVLGFRLLMYGSSASRLTAAAETPPPARPLSDVPE